MSDIGKSLRDVRRMVSMLVAVAAGLQWFAAPSTAVTIDWVTVGDPGNTCDVQLAGCFGGVAYSYRISKYEVTNAQYAEFLNAVAATDTYFLYNPGSSAEFTGFTRSGSAGASTYLAVAGRENMPANNVSFYSSLRFANWLHNGQPTGAQDSSTTEDGAYTITANGISSNSISRNPEALVVLTSQDEWYKAAYYDALSASFFDYPAGSDTPTACAAPGATPNTANCAHAAGLDLTPVGAYSGSASPSGTFDQGGNVYEWNETIIAVSGRGLRGGAFSSIPILLDASRRLGDSPRAFDVDIGFRVAALVPEPATGLLLMAGILVIATRRRQLISTTA